MNFIANLIRTKPYLKFFSSVKLAVPLMIVIIVVVATGTIYESLYNSDYAKMAIYHTSWFFALMCLLWVNILFAALSRWPFNKNHTGFVITHIGLLTLLVGGLVTGSYGLDAQLGITEGTSNATMILPETIVGYQFTDSPRPQTIEIPRGLSEYTSTRDSSLNAQIHHLFWIKKYMPFTAPSRVVVPVKGGEGSNSIGLSFRLKSQFFEVSEWLQSEENPSMALGPAKLSLIVGKYQGEKPAKPSAKSALKAKHPESSALQAILSPEAHADDAQPDDAPAADVPAGMPRTLVVMDFKTGKVIGEKTVKDVLRHPWSVGGVQVRIKKEYHHATVAQNKLAEGNGPENIALELEVIKGADSKREILFAKFSNFSINANGIFGLRVNWGGAAGGQKALPESTMAHGGSVASSAAEPVAEGESTLPPGHPGVGAAQQAQADMPPAEMPSGTPPSDGTPPPMGAGRNVIEFYVDPQDSEQQAEIVLKKDGKVVAHDVVRAGQTYQTPWMGMVITLASVVHGGQTRVIAEPVEPTKGKNLPPSAIEIQLADSDESFWLTEGSSQQVTLMGRPAQIFFDRRTLDLPFQLKLVKFTKKDYPGTETPMSYESLVELPTTGLTQVISMNEPLKKDGFTIYQSSYVIEEGKTPESIFSVNDDPGRPIKYTGSIILALGIIIFTVSRSPAYLTWAAARNKKAKVTT
jgi:ResB-like family